MRKTGKIINCYICGKKFYRAGYWLRRRRIAHLCSRECVAKFNSENRKGKISPFRRPILEIKKCKNCENTIEIRDTNSLRNKKFCSVSCKNTWLNKNLKRNYPRGKDAYWWRGGKTALDKAIRTCKKYKNWRSGVYSRDNFTCVLCGKKGRLQADHYPDSLRDLIRIWKIKNLDNALSCSELWDIKLGRTLCKNCHKKTDTYGLKYIWKLRKAPASD